MFEVRAQLTLEEIFSGKLTQHLLEDWWKGISEPQSEMDADEAAAALPVFCLAVEIFRLNNNLEKIADCVVTGKTGTALKIRS